MGRQDSMERRVKVKGQQNIMEKVSQEMESVHFTDVCDRRVLCSIVRKEDAGSCK